MRSGLYFFLAASVGAVLSVQAAHAQLDLTPRMPAAAPTEQPVARQAPQPVRPASRAPRSAPLPPPRPDLVPSSDPVEARAPAVPAANAAEAPTAQSAAAEPAAAPQQANSPQATPAEQPAAQQATASAPAVPAPAAATEQTAQPQATPVPAASQAAPAAPALAGDSRPAEGPAVVPGSLLTGRIDEAFDAVSMPRLEPPAVAATTPKLARAPLPQPRPATASAESGTPAAPPAASAEAADAATPPKPPEIAPPYATPPERQVQGRAFAEKSYPTGRAAYFETLKKYAEISRVPIDLADAIAVIETAYNPAAVGNAEEIGLMQIRLSTASELLGFTGSVQDLFDPETNIRLGAANLAGAWERAGGNVCQALMKYRIRWDETRISPLSAEYCRRALAYLASIDSPLARGQVAPPSLTAGAGGDHRFDWDEHKQRLRQIDQRFGGENFGIIAR